MERTKSKIALALGLVCVASLASAQGVCPALGQDTDCGTIITITATGATISNTGQPPYDAIEDTLVGVVNNSKLPISVMGLSGPGIFQFDGDGIDTYGAPGNSLDASGYGGPNAYFTNLVTVGSGPNTGLVHFIAPIAANGGTAYFSLEGALGVATACTSIINNALSGPTVGGPTISASFTPNGNYSLMQAAVLCGFSAFDWQQTITSMPSPSPFEQVGNPIPLTAPPPFLDPPPGGYTYELATYPGGDHSYPFYYDPDTGELQSHEPTDFTLDFYDDPTNPCLAGGTGAFCSGKTALPGQLMAFSTRLVGVNGRTAVDLGIGFDWISNFNGTSGGTATTKNSAPPDAGSGTGGATVVAVHEISTYGGLGVTSINGAPVGQPVALQSGTACNGVFTGVFSGDITISNGQNCIIENGSISGGIQENGGNLVLSDSLVSGNLHIKGGTFILNRYAELLGNLEIQHLAASQVPDQICETTVMGNFNLHNSSSTVQIGSQNHAFCGGNVVGGNMQIQQNDGTITIYDNSIRRVLHCDHNANVSGSGNSAGKKIGQCTSL